MNNIRVIFCDIDNTLTNDKEEISLYTSRYFNSINDKIKIILVTGRTNSYAVAKSKEANASEYVIADNGAIIYDYKNRVIIDGKFILKEDLKKIWNMADEYNMNCVFNSIDKRYRCNRFMNNKYEKNGNIGIDSIDEISSPITEIVLLNNNDSIYSIVKTKIERIESLQISNYGKETDGRNFMDINIAGVSKGNAIKKFYELYGYSMDEAIAFGDSYNDISMFESVKLKVAMLNAKEDFKNKADIITKYSNKEDGIMRFLKEYIKDD